MERSNKVVQRTRVTESAIASGSIPHDKYQNAGNIPFDSLRYKWQFKGKALFTCSKPTDPHLCSHRAQKQIAGHPPPPNPDRRRISLSDFLYLAMVCFVSPKDPSDQPRDEDRTRGDPGKHPNQSPGQHHLRPRSRDAEGGVEERNAIATTSNRRVYGIGTTPFSMSNSPDCRQAVHALPCVSGSVGRRISVGSDGGNRGERGKKLAKCSDLAGRASIREDVGCRAPFGASGSRPRVTPRRRFVSRGAAELLDGVDREDLAVLVRLIGRKLMRGEMQQLLRYGELVEERGEEL